jgi:hypothetical protein
LVVEVGEGFAESENLTFEIVVELVVDEEAVGVCRALHWLLMPCRGGAVAVLV